MSKMVKVSDRTYEELQYIKGILTALTRRRVSFEDVISKAIMLLKTTLQEAKVESLKKIYPELAHLEGKVKLIDTPLMRFLKLEAHLPDREFNEMKEHSREHGGYYDVNPRMFVIPKEEAMKVAIEWLESQKEKER